MIFKLDDEMIEGLVLEIISRSEDGNYGFEINQELNRYFNIDESRLFMVLQNLARKNLIEMDDRYPNGKKRRYYKINDSGLVVKDKLHDEWSKFKQGISSIIN